jgi:hypothetical protein
MELEEGTGIRVQADNRCDPKGLGLVNTTTLVEIAAKKLLEGDGKYEKDYTDRFISIC